MDCDGSSRSDCENNGVLFPSSLLSKLDCSQCSFVVKHGMEDFIHPSPGLTLRPLEETDFEKGYLQLLSQLTRVGEVSKEKFAAQFRGMRSCPGCYYIVVVEDTSTSKVVSTATLLVERKFIHGVVTRGRIEDVVVDGGYRGLRLGSLLVELLTTLSVHLGCYKTTLDCKPDKIEFYERFGFKQECAVFMVQRFFD